VKRGEAFSLSMFDLNMIAIHIRGARLFSSPLKCLRAYVMRRVPYSIEGDIGLRSHRIETFIFAGRIEVEN